MTLSVEVPPSSPPPSGPASTDMSETERRLVKRLRSGRTSLPMLPHVATVALSLANDPAASVMELAELVDGDPPIAARFLSVANSAAYWRGHNASSTQAAIVRLGLAATRDLLFQVVYAASTQGLKRYQTQVQASFARSVRCGVVTRAVCRELRQPYEYAYMAGLLHDIGEARVYRVLASLPKCAEGPAHIKELVRRHHAEAGAEVAMTWRLPADIVDVCAAHHDPQAASVPHVRLVMIADAIVDFFEHEKNRRWEPFDFTRFEALDVSEAQAKALIERAKRELTPRRDSQAPSSARRSRFDPPAVTMRSR